MPAGCHLAKTSDPLSPVAKDSPQDPGDHATAPDPVARPGESVPKLKEEMLV